MLQVLSYDIKNQSYQLTTGSIFNLIQLIWSDLPTQKSVDIGYGCMHIYPPIPIPNLPRKLG